MSIKQELSSIKLVLNSGILSGYRARGDYRYGGEKVSQFEEDFKAYFGVKHAIAFNSATSALHTALLACGIGKGDEVIVTPFSFSASASCVLMARATPVFADIEFDIFCIDSWEIRRVITDKTKAIIPVHLFGHPADMKAINYLARYYGLKVMEDCAQAIGAKYNGEYVGTIGDCGVFSFNQHKQVNTGEGGMLITNDDEIAEKARLIGNHGENQADILGYNYRMTEVTAAIGIERFKGLDAELKRRNQVAAYLTEGLSKIKGLTPPVIYPNCTHSFYAYAVKFDEDIIGMSRDKFQDKMIEKGIYFGKGCLTPIHLLPVFGGDEGQCPVAERMWRRELMFTDLIKYPQTKKQICGIIKIAKDIIG